MSDAEKTTQLFTYEHDARRVELLVRIFYSIAIAIIMFVYGFIAGILMIIQWFVILILGHRNEGLSDFELRITMFSTYTGPYPVTIR